MGFDLQSWKTLLLAASLVFLAQASTAREYKLTSRGGSVSANDGGLEYKCDDGNFHNGMDDANAVFVLTADESLTCERLQINVTHLSSSARIHLYDGSEIKTRFSCGLELNASSLGEIIEIEGPMATVVLVQPQCSVNEPSFACTWECSVVNSSPAPATPYGGFVNTERGKLTWSDLNAQKRHTTAILGEGDLCVTIKSDFAQGDAVNNCQSSRLTVHEIGLDGCISRLHEVCERFSTFRAPGVRPFLLADAEFDPSKTKSFSNSYEVDWTDKDCDDDCANIQVTAPTSPATTIKTTPEPTTTTTTPEPTTTTTTTTTPEPTTTTTTTTTPEPTTTTTTTTTTPEPTTTTTTTTTPEPTTTTTTTTTTPEPTTTTTTTTPEPTTTTTTTTTTPEPTTTTTTPEPTTTTTTTTPEPTTTTTTTTPEPTTTTTEIPDCPPNSTTPAVKPEAITISQCGGQVFIPCYGSAFIRYKEGTTYNNNEICNWIIHSPSREVNVTFVSQSFERKYDGCTIASFDTNKPDYSCERVEEYKTTRTVNTPFILQFSSDSSVRRSGFVVKMESVAGCWEKYHIDTFHSSDSSGSLKYPINGDTNYRNKARFMSIIQSPSPSATRTFSWGNVDLESYYDGVSCFQMRPFKQISGPACNTMPRISGTYKAGALASNTTSDSFGCVGWSDASNVRSGWELGWNTAPRTIDEPTERKEEARSLMDKVMQGYEISDTL